MNRNDLIRTCVQNLLRRKSRTMLTVLGVVIGCCSIVVMASIGFGMRESQERLLSQMGDLTIIKTLGFPTDSMESIRKPMEEEARQKQLMLAGLGAVALVVAALGIANTMMTSISERTREIGIMKSLGCYVYDVRKLFLLEAAVIGFVGGMTGCFISFLVSASINFFSLGPPAVENLLPAIAGGENISRVSVIPLWLYGFSIVFSVLIGVGSGFYPANKAVRIPALEAIR